MKWRPKWSTVTIALAVIAALAIASPVLGLSNSIKKAIKKEVTKQIAKASGPAGANGTDGTNGAPATKLFAAVDQNCASVARSSGGVTVAISGTSASICIVTFPQAVAQCVPVVTLRQGGSSGELSAAGNQDGAAVTDNQVIVSYHDSAGAPITSSRQSFFIAVFC
jgi:hypothetical protein